MTLLSNLFGVNFINLINISFFLVLFFLIFFLFLWKTIFLNYFFSLCLILIGFIIIIFEKISFTWFFFIRNHFFKLFNEKNKIYFIFFTENYLFLEILFILFSVFCFLIISILFYFIFLKKRYFLFNPISKINNFCLKLLILPFLFLGISFFYTPIYCSLEKIEYLKLEKTKKDFYIIDFLKKIKIFETLKNKNVSIFLKTNNKTNYKVNNFNTESLLFFFNIEHEFNELNKQEKYNFENLLKKILKKYLPMKIFISFENTVKLNETTLFSYPDKFYDFFNNEKYKNILYFSYLLS